MEENLSILEVLVTSTIVNPHGIQRKVEFYHRTKGMKVAGAGLVPVPDSFGVRIHFSDGTTGGICNASLGKAEEYWYNLNHLEPQA